MDAWFHTTQAKCEVVLETKLTLYAEACATLTASLHHRAAATPAGGDHERDAEGDIGGEARAADWSSQPLFLEKMRLEGPLKPPKRSGFLDTIEQQLHATYDGLGGGYTLDREDERAFEHAKFSAHMPAATTAADAGTRTGAGGGPQLYGELTSQGVRQLHYTVLQCLERSGAAIHSDEAKTEEETHGFCQQRPHAVVGVDVGCGTGKLLFEWSLLTQRDAASCYWTHVGLELAPSRMRVARRAMRGGESLVYLPTEQRWCVEPPSGGEGQQQRKYRDVRVVLGEADVFTPGLLSNETFLPLADGRGIRDAALDDLHTKVPSHLVVFCCGLGFAEPAVFELCAALERMWRTSHTSLSPPWRSLTCVLLLRAFAELRSFPLFRLCTEATGHRDGGVGFLSRVQLSTTWMDETPAWLLELSRA
ncbi:hypothetical protein TRSC58_04491 [Trypanosoma rangeli SC58]|uniref:Methyltransferase domain-containing protein n=1 Tax=Trypanosoma rangeli SC58 TaxID=429131 RepID=A0A061J0Z8_TRYRA|nr:hypothetical protein TRSC58_04491 [Trypanosoma rangeli SC58]